MLIKKQYIGNEQPLPIPLIIETLLDFLDSKTVNKDNLINKAKIYYKGKNRLNKTVNAIYSIVSKSSILNTALFKKFSASEFCSLPEIDKRIIVLSMICLRYPFMFNLLTVLGKLLTVQDVVNKQYIIKKMAAIYGSNLSLLHALDANLSIAVDANIITREKRGLFSKSAIPKIGPFAKEAYIYTWFELNGRKLFLVDNLKYEPFMFFLDNVSINWDRTNILKGSLSYGNKIVIDKVLVKS